MHLLYIPTQDIQLSCQTRLSVVENISQDSIKLTLDTLVLQDSSIVNGDTLFIKYSGGSNLLRSASGHDVGQFFGAFEVNLVYEGVNNTPQRLAGSVADLYLAEDAAPISLGFENLAYSPGDGEDHQTLNYLVEDIPDADFGVIKLSDGTVIQKGNSYTIEQIRGLTFVASENANGNSEFSFIVEDSGVLQAPSGGSERSALNVYIDDQEILEQEASRRIDLNQDGIYSVNLSLSLVDITSTTTSESDQRFVYSNQDGDIILTSLSLDHSEGAKLVVPTQTGNDREISITFDKQIGSLPTVVSLNEIFSFTSDDPAFTTGMSQSIDTYSDNNSIFESITHGSDMNTIVLTVSQGVLDLLPNDISLQLNYNPSLSQDSSPASLFASQSTSGDNIYVVSDFSLSFDRNGTIFNNVDIVQNSVYSGENNTYSLSALSSLSSYWDEFRSGPLSVLLTTEPDQNYRVPDGYSVGGVVLEVDSENLSKADRYSLYIVKDDYSDVVRLTFDLDGDLDTLMRITMQFSTL